MHIRLLEHGDIDAVAALLRQLASRFILHETPQAQAAAFLAENDARGVGANLDSGFVYHVAADEGEGDGVIAGFIGMRARQHVYHLFVGEPWQGRGLSRRLWDAGRAAAIAAGGAPPFTVNASNFALPAYQRLGFVRTAPMMEKNGIVFNPMRWEG